MDNPIKGKIDALEQVLKKLPAKVAVTVENFTAERFRAQNWLDRAAEPWQPRKADKAKDEGRAVLVKTGQLRRSIKARARGMDVTIGSDKPYAQIHNEGGTVTGTQNVGSHTRKAHSRKGYTRKDGRQVKAVKVAAHSVKGFSRKINHTMPKRQFMGASSALVKEIGRLVEWEINKAMK